MPREVAGTAVSFETVPLPKDFYQPSARGPGSHLFTEFLSTEPAIFRANPVERQWVTFSGSDTPMPIASANAGYVKAHGSAVRSEFAGRNFGYVLDYILLNGRAVWNTIVFCLLAIITQLTVNPIAAYALSRYPVRQSGKILIFLLATMAFPAEVAMIPSFLLLKDLGLLNTFAALVLPGAASGFMIFLLKGFFDSLPQELFEAASIDGAPETTMMLKIAFPLSRPVLGYLALLAFMGSYGAFIYAYLVAQDQRIWTLMVWIYQLQSGGAPKAVIMAALTLAALPTLVVFLCTQRVIMRGIVLPGER
jgi:multiple sugar transport system permease protein